MYVEVKAKMFASQYEIIYKESLALSKFEFLLNTNIDFAINMYSFILILLSLTIVTINYYTYNQ